jgi:hypothetical protein
MKIKFIIAQAGVNGYWNYYKVPKLKIPAHSPSHRPSEPAAYNQNKIVDGFVLTDIGEALQFDTYEQAQATIDEFDKLIEVKKTKTGYEHIFIGAGIYKIDKIFINEVPSTTVVAI